MIETTTTPARNRIWWPVDAADPNDPPHNISAAVSLSLRADGRPRRNLRVKISGDDTPRTITTAEAREIARALVDAADYVDQCKVVTL
jgi:hypothetical protein